MPVAIGDDVTLLHSGRGASTTVAVSALEIKSQFGNYLVSVYEVTNAQVSAGDVIFMLTDGRWFPAERISIP